MMNTIANANIFKFTLGLQQTKSTRYAIVTIITVVLSLFAAIGYSYSYFSVTHWTFKCSDGAEASTAEAEYYIGLCDCVSTGDAKFTVNVFNVTMPKKLDQVGWGSPLDTVFPSCGVCTTGGVKCQGRRDYLETSWKSQSVTGGNCSLVIGSPSYMQAYCQNVPAGLNETQCNLTSATATVPSCTTKDKVKYYTLQRYPECTAASGSKYTKGYFYVPPSPPLPPAVEKFSMADCNTCLNIAQEYCSTTTSPDAQQAPYTSDAPYACQSSCSTTNSRHHSQFYARTGGTSCAVVKQSLNAMGWSIDVTSYTPEEYTCSAPVEDVETILGIEVKANSGNTAFKEVGTYFENNAVMEMICAWDTCWPSGHYYALGMAGPGLNYTYTFDLMMSAGSSTGTMNDPHKRPLQPPLISKQTASEADAPKIKCCGFNKQTWVQEGTVVIGALGGLVGAVTTVCAIIMGRFVLTEINVPVYPEKIGAKCAAGEDETSKRPTRASPPSTSPPPPSTELGMSSSPIQNYSDPLTEEP